MTSYNQKRTKLTVQVMDVTIIQNMHVRIQDMDVRIQNMDVVIQDTDVTVHDVDLAFRRWHKEILQVTRYSLMHLQTTHLPVLALDCMQSAMSTDFVAHLRQISVM
jgi:hypothetical protein